MEAPAVPWRLAAPAPGWADEADVVVIGSGIAGPLAGGPPRPRRPAPAGHYWRDPRRRRS